MKTPYSRAQLNEAQKNAVEWTVNNKNQAVDPNTKQPLVKGKIDLGHKFGYEEYAMQKFANRMHLPAKDYHAMMKNPRIYQWEDQHENRSGKHECREFRTQLKNYMNLYREYRQNKEQNNKKRVNSRTQKARASKSSVRSRNMRTQTRNARTSRIAKARSGRTIQGARTATGGRMGVRGGRGSFGGGRGGSGGGRGGSGGGRGSSGGGKGK